MTDQKKGNIEEVREILMQTMRQVKDGSIDIERASEIRELGQTLINSAKVEVDFLKVTGSPNQTGFIADQDMRPKLPSQGGVPRIGQR